MSSILPRELRWLLRQTMPYLWLQLTSVVFIIASSMLGLLDPLVMKWLLDKVLPQRNIHQLFVALGMIFGCYVGSAMLGTFGGLFTTQASQQMVFGLRRKLLEHLDTLSPDYHERESVGARLYLFQGPLGEIGQMGVDLLPSVLQSTILFGTVLVTMLILNTRLTLMLIPIAPLFLWMQRVNEKHMHGRSDELQKEQRSVTSFLQEHLSAITQLQLLSAEKRRERSGFLHFGRLVRAQWQLGMTTSLFGIGVTAVGILGSIVVLGMGSREYLQGRLTIGGLVAFYTYLSRLFGPLSGMMGLYSRWQKVGASIRRVMEAFELRPTVVEHPQAAVLSSEIHGEIELQDVFFGYTEGRNILRGINFRVEPAARIALVGQNGSGKSTTGKLLARLYDPRSGLVRLDGRDIREVRIKDLRRHICYLPQHAILFDTDMRANLRLGNPATSESELAWAIELAELENIVRRLPGGLKCSLGPSGNRLSGGERQRVAIARAALQRPRILVLDEATSFLEGRIESVILSKLRNALPSTTLVVISHHLSALHWIDEIFVLDRGTIIQHGSHEDLSSQGGLFTQMFHGREKKVLSF